MALCPCLNEEFVVQKGTTATIQGELLAIDLDSVADSRCPANARCVWEGDAVVALTIVKAGQKPGRLELHTSPRFAPDAKYRDYTVRLVALAPMPSTDAKVDQAAYRATILVTR